MTNKVTGRSRGYGFVNFVNEDSAKSAISAMNGQVRELKNHRSIYLPFMLIVVVVSLTFPFVGFGMIN